MRSNLVEISKKIAEERKSSPDELMRMNAATSGQAPRFLLISPIDRSFQDIELFGLNQGDAFYGSRVPGISLLPRGHLPFLLGGPIAYNEQFSAEDGIIVTFEMDEPYDAVRTTINNLASYTETRGIPIIGIRVDYSLGRGRLVAHGKGRDYELETKLMSSLIRPEELDQQTLILMCSDSRITLKHIPTGAPMAIRTLGGYIPGFVQSSEETRLLDGFFEKWLSSNPDTKNIVLLAHGSSEYDGASCGAAEASLCIETPPRNAYAMMLMTMNLVASSYEEESPNMPEERAISLAKATSQNIKSYPSIIDASNRGFDFASQIHIMFMDTVTNVITEIG